ncbi:hypothetical protein [Streptomyces sp. NPDC018000]|uniref:hypothetical protein n=1 Tax=Streptomyces sp. NPDC018000 TaxID=3365028 RepID=UPI0037AC8061
MPGTPEEAAERARFDALVAEAAVSVDGWDFSWLDGRATEQRPSWGYARELFDIGAVVYFLRKVIWMVPGFTVGEYRPQLAALHHRIETEGPFVAHTTRFLIEARTPQ